MNKIRQRNSDIVRRKQRGTALSDIARKFRLSRESIRMIVEKHRLEQERRDRSASFLDALRMSDDPERRWPVLTLVEALVPIAVTRTSLLAHYESSSVVEVSMRDFMDMVVSDGDCPRPGFALTPILDIRKVGKKGFWFTVSRLSDVGLGSRCQALWPQKLERLKRVHRIKGPHPHSWSKPASNPYL